MISYKIYILKEGENEKTRKGLEKNVFFQKKFDNAIAITRKIWYNRKA